MTLPEKCPSRSGHIFLGWSATSTNTIPTYYMVDNQYNIQLTTDANTILYAVWGLKGDINLDKKVTLADVQLAMSYCNGTKTLNVHEKKIMDYNDDGYLDANDVELIQKKALGTS